MYSAEQVQEMVINAVASSLSLEKEEVDPAASLVDDLAMDSLDFLDVLFSLEKSLNVKLLGGEINKMLRPGVEQENTKAPNLTPDEIAQMTPYIPALKKAVENGDTIPRAKLFKFVTAETLLAVIMKEIADKEI